MIKIYTEADRMTESYGVPVETLPGYLFLKGDDSSVEGVEIQVSEAAEDLFKSKMYDRTSATVIDFDVTKAISETGDKLISYVKSKQSLSFKQFFYLYEPFKKLSEELLEELAYRDNYIKLINYILETKEDFAKDDISSLVTHLVPKIQPKKAVPIDDIDEEEIFGKPAEKEETENIQEETAEQEIVVEDNSTTLIEDMDESYQSKEKEEDIAVTSINDDGDLIVDIDLDLDAIFEEARQSAKKSQEERTNRAIDKVTKGKSNTPAYRDQEEKERIIQLFERFNVPVGG